MSHFKEFCDSTPKNKDGYVPDLLDLVAQGFGDLCMASYLSDKLSSNYNNYGEYYMSLSNTSKNIIYSSNELACQDAIDAYNQAIDDAREKAKNLELMDDHTFISLIDPDYKYRHFNQAMFDAGHKESDFA